MKKIVLQIEDEIFNELESSLITKYIMGNLYGILDEFIILLVMEIKAGKKEIEITRKKKRKKRKKS